tara:strand:- start:985 stop:1581 length:597 start_codon:yes stop_codon:yes gene_type:complete
MNHFLDLFSGLGGASEAFVNSSNWCVLRIDNNPLLGGVPYTIIKDITTMTITPYPDATIDVIWASPPCTDFSNGYSSPKSIHIRENGIESYEPDMSLLMTTIDIIETVKPRYWIIENVVGAIRYFEPHLGEPRQIIGPYVLWGNFPLLDVDKGALKDKKYKDVHSSNPLRSNYKAKVDYAISASLKLAIEQQKQITDF